MINKDTFKDIRILVIGDVMLDHYIKGTVTRLSPEAPVPVVHKTVDEYYLGGAGNVFSNVVSLGAKCDLLSVIGDDFSGTYVSHLIEMKSQNRGVLLQNSNRKTTTKIRVIGNSHQIVRVDDEDSSEIDAKIQEDLIRKFDSIIDGYDGVILEDYNKGILVPSLIVHVISKCRAKNIPVLVDPKMKYIDSYAGCTIFKPNLSEFSFITGKSFSPDLVDLHSELYAFKEKMNIDLMIVTLSERGIIYGHKSQTKRIEGFPVNVSDVSGAGDSVSAMLLLSFISKIQIDSIARLCNIVGAIACSKIGAVSVSIDEVLENIHTKGI